MKNYGLRSGFIKTINHRPTDHRLTNPPTTFHLPNDPATPFPPTQRPVVINLC